jgi:oligopeptide/dipeptide ABC transporter ATP-binding protein
MAILRLVQAPGRIVGGKMLLDGIDIVTLNDAELRDVRWRKMALVPQGAMNSLNPVMRINTQLGDAIVTHQPRISAAELKERLLDLLNMVGLPSRIYSMYPHELSGGMKQRVCIAMAVALNPSLIIADEPTSALDVVVQRVVAQTLLDIKDRLGVSMVVIGHDMGLMAQLADRIAVMYAGHLVELAPVRQIYAQPMHPYTQLLIESIPSIKERKPLKITEGITHDLRNPPPGCIFQSRCPQVMDICRQVRPPLLEHPSRQQVACHLYEK